MKDICRLTVLGCRGSLPVCGEAYREFGGASSSYLLECGEEALLLDGGSGIRTAPDRWTDSDGQSREIPILLSHSHVDHMLGLAFFPPLMQPGRRIHAWLKTRAGLNGQEQVNRLFSPPLWPLKTEEAPAHVTVSDSAAPFAIGCFSVDAIESNHPGGASIYRVECGKRSLVYATDFEHSEENTQALISFAGNCDLLLYDGQYTDAEYPALRGFGHSTADKGLEAMKHCGARRLMIIHHDPGRTDEQLKRMEQELKESAKREGISPDTVFFAREGMVTEW